MNKNNEELMKEFEGMKESNPVAYALCRAVERLERECETLKSLLEKEMEEHAQDKEILDEIISKEMEEELALTVAKGLAEYGYDVCKSVEMAKVFVEKVKF